MIDYTWTTDGKTLTYVIFDVEKNKRSKYTVDREKDTKMFLYLVLSFLSNVPIDIALLGCKMALNKEEEIPAVPTLSINEVD